MQEEHETWSNEPNKELYLFMIENVIYAKTAVIEALKIEKEGNVKVL